MKNQSEKKKTDLSVRAYYWIAALVIVNVLLLILNLRSLSMYREVEAANTRLAAELAELKKNPPALQDTAQQTVQQLQQTAAQTAQVVSLHAEQTVRELQTAAQTTADIVSKQAEEASKELQVLAQESLDRLSVHAVENAKELQIAAEQLMTRFNQELQKFNETLKQQQEKNQTATPAQTAVTSNNP